MIFEKCGKSILPLLFIVGLWIAAFPGLASAHASIVSSSPASGEPLDEPPDSIRIQFNEPVERAFFSLTVLGPDGERVDSGDARIDENRSDLLTAGLKTGLPDGAYTVNWKVVSSDGHPISGTFTFLVGGEGADQAAPAVDRQASAWPGSGLVIFRFLWYAGMTLLSGVLVFPLILLPRELRGNPLAFRSKLVLYSGLALAIIGILSSLPQQTAAYAGVTWSRAWDRNLLLDTLQRTEFGTVWTIQLVLLLVLTIFIVWLTRTTANRSLSRIVSCLALIFTQGLFMSKAFIGHAAAAESRILAIAADYLHLSASALWLGGLLSIFLLLPSATGGGYGLSEARPESYWVTVRRFSGFAAGCVSVLLISGIYSSVLHVGSFGDLIQTAYGRVLLIKIILFLLMLGLALQGFIRGQKRNRPLGRGVWMEFCAGLLVLALAALLSNLPAPSAGQIPAGHLEETVQGYRIIVDVSPNVIGSNHMSVRVEDQSGKPLDNIEQVTLRLTSNEMDMGVIEVVMPGGLQPEADAIITMAGSWNVNVHILLKTLESIDHDFTLDVESVS